MAAECPRCGSQLSADLLEGHCANCLVYFALEPTGDQPNPGELFHHSFRGAADHWARCQHYARLWAQTQREQGKTTNPVAPYLHAAVRWLRGEYPNLQLNIKRVLAEADMVVTHSHLDLEPGNSDNPGQALADFFRLEDGKVVEHWDVIQSVPNAAKNDNGMF